MMPVAQRPPGYSPLGEKNLDPDWIARLSKSGKDCYDAILARDVKALGASMNLCMTCWEKILPNTVRHPSHHGRPDGPPGSLPGPICRCHVFWLRRRVSIRGFGRTGSGSIPGKGKNQR